MPNEKGWFTKEEAHESGLPLWMKVDSKKPGKWTKKPYANAVLLTRTRCNQLKMPALQNGKEASSALKYNNAESSKYRYVPLFDRSSVFEAGELSYDILLDGELMTAD
ncbi:hypothetical protein ACFSR7_05820 [Cohnella sp. GCM10020058]|uniref:hypothetical protein n=1 Tax=Cohnella sp. GCM10020058 TaxID=3317330 RepID=UPI00363EA830